MTSVYSERTLYDNPWVRLVQMEIEPPNGRRFWHHVVRLQTVSVAIVLDNADRVLLMRRHRFATDQVGWEAPGGIVGPNEQPEEAAAREALEETGWRPTGPGLTLAAFQPMPGMVDTPHEVFLFRGADRVGDPTDLEEAAVVEWVPLDRAREFVGTGQVLGAATIIGLLTLWAGHAEA
ncbi:NUDIX domain-containing protein [Promicromonospora sp. MS192]|uniref:NUDIX domain-containing protein n=1 Tax=Promicromonospora sp. MS192 TaxID=3412684 RepID=UPI003C2C36E0